MVAKQSKPQWGFEAANGLAAGKMEGPRPDKFAFVKRSGTIKSPVGTLSDRTVMRQQDGGALPRQVTYWAFIDHAPSWGVQKICTDFK